MWRLCHITELSTWLGHTQLQSPEPCSTMRSEIGVTVYDRILDCCSIALLLIHVTVFGVIAGRFLMPVSLNRWTRFGAAGCLGFVAFALEIFLLGYLKALQQLPLLISGLIAFFILLLFAYRKKDTLLQESRAASGAVLQSVQREKLLFAIVFFAVALLLLSCARPPLSGDEIEYHWAAPKFWAQHGAWVKAPCKLVNGPSLIEWLYTWSAVWNSSTSAHLTHLALFFLLMVGAAGLGVSIGASPLLVIAALLAIPVAVNQASISFNDVGMAALLVNAYGVLLSSHQSLAAPASDRFKNASVAGILLGAAYMAKSLALGALPFAVIYQFVSASKSAWRSSMAAAVYLLIPVAIAIAIGAAHSFYLTGELSDPSRKPQIGTIPPHPNWLAAVYIARDPNDAMLLAGTAAGRIPTAKDILTLPLTPFIASVLGQREPYGGRTGLVILVFLPLFLYRFRSSLKSRSVEFWILAAALAYFAVVAPFFIKTRFNIFVWSLLTVCSVSALNSFQPGRLRKILSVVFTIAVFLGVIDASRILLRN